MAARSTSRFKQKPAVPFGDFMLPILGVIALGIVVAGVRLLWAPRTSSPTVIEQPRAAQPVVRANERSERPAETVDLAATLENSRRETVQDVVIAQPVRQGSSSSSNTNAAASNSTERRQTQSSANRTASQQNVTRVEPRRTPPAASQPQRRAPVQGGSIDRSAFVVQCGSYTDRNAANSVVQSLKNVGYTSVVRQAEVRGKTYYRVIVAGGGDRATAKEIATGIKAAGYPVLVRTND